MMTRIPPDAPFGTGVDAIDQALSLLGLSPDRAPQATQWAEFLRFVANAYHHSDASRFENLFEASPVPTIEQDYTLVIDHFAVLRSEGVTDIQAHLAGNPGQLRSLVGAIRNVAANPAAIEVMGLKPDQVVAFVDPAIMNEGAEDAFIDQFETVWSERTFSVFEFVGRTADGEAFDTRRTMSAPSGPHGPDYSRVVLTFEDLTDARDEQRRLEQLVATKNEFLAAVSHEIRTPLTGIFGFAEVLIDAGESMDWSEVSELLHSITLQTQDVTNIVEDLLMATRSESGDLAVTRERVDLVFEVENVMRLGGAHTAGVVVDRPEAEVTAIGDPGRVRQIIRNLLTNAERYGGPDVHIEIRNRADWTEISVSDDGEGVPPRRADAIFSSRRDGDSATVSGSSGLGLSICRNLALLMGGKLEYSRSDERSRFTLKLPSEN